MTLAEVIAADAITLPELPDVTEDVQYQEGGDPPSRSISLKAFVSVLSAREDQDAQGAKRRDAKEIRVSFATAALAAPTQRGRIVWSGGQYAITSLLPGTVWTTLTAEYKSLVSVGVQRR